MSNPIEPPLSRRAARQAQLSAQDAPPEGFAQPLDRRARGGTPVSVPSSPPSDVSYRTQVRPRVPHYDAAPPTHTVIPGGSLVAPVDGGIGSGDPAHSAAPLHAPSPIVAPEPLVEPPVAPSAASAQMRRRDFRPPVERLEMPAVAPPTYDTSLDYHTQLTPRPDAPAASLGDLADTASGASAVPPVHVIGAAPGTQRPEFAATAPPVEEPAIGTPPMSAPPVTAPPVTAPPVMATPTTAPPVEHGAAALEQTLSRRELRALREAAGLPVDPEPAGHPDPAGPVVFEPAAPVAPEPAPPVAFEPAPPAPAWPAASLPPAPEPAAVPSAPSSSAPTGSHWSVGIHDDDDPFENTFSREVGSAVSMTNTNALVLPQMPLGSLSGPVAGTGEIIITGMIDLPRAVSSTGTVPTVHESPDIDDLFDPGDLAAGPADAAPVSALRAVSSHTGTTGVMTAGRGPAGNTVTTVLVAATVVMAVVAIGLFVLAAVNGLF